MGSNSSIVQSRKDLAASLESPCYEKSPSSHDLTATSGTGSSVFARDTMASKNSIDVGSDHLITSTDPEHPANLICTLCRSFYNHGWVTGTGGGTSIVKGSHIFIAPSGVQKELM